MRLRWIVGLAGLTLLPVVAGAMEIRVDPPNAAHPGFMQIHLTGDIVRGDYDRFVAALLSDPSDTHFLSVLIASNGGNALEGIRIGGLLAKLHAVVSAYSTCNSACVFVVAGGRGRISSPPLKMGLHRPYFDPSEFAGLTAEQAATKYRELEKMVRDYLIVQRVPQATIERMFDTASENIFYLSADEVNDGAVGEGDPAFDEWLTARCGAVPNEAASAFAACMDDHRMADPACLAVSQQVASISVCKNRLVAAENQKVFQALRGEARRTAR